MEIKCEQSLWAVCTKIVGKVYRGLLSIVEFSGSSPVELSGGDTEKVFFSAMNDGEIENKQKPCKSKNFDCVR